MSDTVRQVYWATRRAFGRRRLLFFGAVLTAIRAGDAGGSIVVDQADTAVLRDLADARGAEVAEYEARLAAGHRLIHIGHGGEPIAAWGWITLAGNTARWAPWEGAAGLSIPPHSAYFWDYFTRIAARGKGLYPMLLRDGMAYAAQHGARSGSIYCDVDNLASRKGIAGAGFDAPAEASLLRLGPLYFARGEGGRHVSLGAAAVPIDLLLPAPRKPGDHIS